MSGVGEFERIKEQGLNKIFHDKSSKGSIDIPILPLVRRINQLDDYFTTSSCSGRISITKELEGITKHRNAWIFKSHNKISVEELERISLPEELCIIKFETVILHLAARDVKSGLRMLRVARESGWKKSGIISAKRNKVTLECSSTEYLAMPFSKNCERLPSKKLLMLFIEEANKKLDSAHKKIYRFLEDINKEWI